MKRTMKRTVSVFLTALFLLSAFSTGYGTFAADEGYQNGDIIEFGSYPQSRVTDEETLATLNEMELEWHSYGYYIYQWDSYYLNNEKQQHYDSNYEMQLSDYMQYADVEWNGERYRAVCFQAYRASHNTQSGAGASYQDEYGYVPTNVYWFRWEPLQWILLNRQTGLVVCSSVIDAQPFNQVIYKADGYVFTDKDRSAYASNYELSSVRRWLTDETQPTGFLSTAFSAYEADLILPTALDNQSVISGAEQYSGSDTEDKVFLFSGTVDEIKSYYSILKKYWEKASLYRLHQNTMFFACASDYAKCQGVPSIVEKKANSTDITFLEGTIQMGRLPNSGGGGFILGYSAIGDTRSDSVSYTNGIRPLMRLDSSVLQTKPTASGSTAGTCGRTMQWEFDESAQTLTIHGTGLMDDYSECTSAAPWAAFRSQIRTVDVQSGVESIGAYAFMDCTAMTSVSLPDSLQFIRQGAFWYCSQLTDVVIPNTVTQMDRRAFFDCAKLENVVLSDGLSEISDAAFCCNYALKNIDIGSEIRTIRSFAFCFCETLENTVLPDSVTSIQKFAFQECKQLHIHIPSTVASIPNSFGLVAGICSDSENSAAKTYADSRGIPFELCSGHLSQMPVSGSCGENVQWAFDEESGVLSLTGIGAMDSIDAFEDYGYSAWQNDIQFVVAADGVTGIGAHAFEGCPALEEIILGPRTTMIGDSAFADCPKLANVTTMSNVLSAKDALPKDRTDWTLVAPMLNDQAVSVSREYGVPLVTFSYIGSMLSFNGDIIVHDDLAYSYLPVLVEYYSDAQTVYFERLVFADIPPNTDSGQRFLTEYYGSLAMENVKVSLVYIAPDGHREDVTYARMLELLQSGDYSAFKLRIVVDDTETTEETIAKKLEEIFPFVPKRVLRIVSKAINFIVNIFKKK